MDGPFSSRIEEWLDHLTAERGLSANTVAAYRRDLAQFASHVGKETQLVDLRESHVVGFMSTLKRQGHAEAEYLQRTLPAQDHGPKPS